MGIPENGDFAFRQINTLIRIRRRITILIARAVVSEQTRYFDGGIQRYKNEKKAARIQPKPIDTKKFLI